MCVTWLIHVCDMTWLSQWIMMWWIYIYPSHISIASFSYKAMDHDAMDIPLRMYELWPQWYIHCIIIHCILLLSYIHGYMRAYTLHMSHVQRVSSDDICLIYPLHPFYSSRTHTSHADADTDKHIPFAELTRRTPSVDNTAPAIFFVPENIVWQFPRNIIRIYHPTRTIRVMSHISIASFYSSRTHTSHADANTDRHIPFAELTRRTPSVDNTAPAIFFVPENVAYGVLDMWRLWPRLEFFCCSVLQCVAVC